MRKLVFAINLTTDGCCDHAAGIPDDEVLEFFTKLTQEGDALLYGRKTYELMVPYWPDIAKESAGQSTPDVRFAEAFMAVPQMIVVSKTLEKIEGHKTRIIRSDLKNEILKLKQEPGGNILTGGVTLPTELLELGLVDEMHFVIQPVIFGKGRRLFDQTNFQEKYRLKLKASKVFKSGTVALHYSKN